MSYDIGVAIAGICAGGLLIYMGMSINKQHGAMQLLFGAVGMFIISLTLGMVNEIALAEGATVTVTTLLTRATTLMTMIIRVAAAYLMIMFLWYVMNKMMVKHKRGA